MIRVATRGSPLALLQAEEVAARLRGLGAEVKVVPMRTEGDRRAAARLAEIGGKGLFVRELEQAPLAGDADVAVHSLKDVPIETVVPAVGQGVLAVQTRRDDDRTLRWLERGAASIIPLLQEQPPR